MHAVGLFDSSAAVVVIYDAPSVVASFRGKSVASWIYRVTIWYNVVKAIVNDMSKMEKLIFLWIREIERESEPRLWVEKINRGYGFTLCVCSRLAVVEKRRLTSTFFRHSVCCLPF